MFQAICIVFLIKIGGSVKGQDVFTAVAHFEDLLEAHKRVKDYLAHYIERHEKRLAVLKSFLDIFKREHEKAIEDLTNYLSDPVNVLTLMKRLTTDVYYIKHSIRDETDNIEMITKKYYNYPTLTDLRGAANGIARLQDFYALEVKDFTDKKLNITTYSTPMMACDCFELGRVLYEEKNFVTGLEWMLEAFQKYNEEEIHYQFSAFDIIEYISYGYSKMGDVRRSLQWIQKILKQDPENSRAREIEKICYATMVDERYGTMENHIKNKEAKRRELKATRDAAYYRLCRGDTNVPIPVANRLTCRYLTENHPFSKLAPFKIEMLYVNPDVVLFYDVIRDSEIETVKKMAKCKLRRSGVQGPLQSRESNKRTVTHYRISKSTLVYSPTSETIARISRRIEQMTGLNLKFSEDLQVANYGIGGYYAIHYDYLSNCTNLMNGNRMATVLFYLSEVTRGGATVFPKLGITVFPIKGAAIFWYNIYNSGEMHVAMQHIACPVLQGSKWVSTRWIHEYGQEFIKPCDLEHDEKVQRKRSRLWPKIPPLDGYW